MPENEIPPAMRVDFYCQEGRGGVELWKKIQPPNMKVHMNTYNPKHIRDMSGVSAVDGMNDINLNIFVQSCFEKLVFRR